MHHCGLQVFLNLSLTDQTNTLLLLLYFYGFLTFEILRQGRGKLLTKYLHSFYLSSLKAHVQITYNGTPNLIKTAVGSRIQSDLFHVHNRHFQLTIIFGPLLIIDRN